MQNESEGVPRSLWVTLFLCALAAVVTVLYFGWRRWSVEQRLFDTEPVMVQELRGPEGEPVDRIITGDSPEERELCRLLEQVEISSFLPSKDGRKYGSGSKRYYVVNVVWGNICLRPDEEIPAVLEYREGTEQFYYPLAGTEELLDYVKTLLQ